MKFTVAIAALLGAAVALRIKDDSEPEGRNLDTARWQEMHISGYNGADEDEIMDNIFSKFSKEGITPSGHKTGQKLLMKDQAKLACGTVLEAAHKLKPADVPAFLDANFENSWSHFDQNHEGWIRYEETHTFQRHLQGNLNKFANAPGSITDLSSGGPAYPLNYPLDSESVGVTHV
jgi:hypothetical protein